MAALIIPFLEHLDGSHRTSFNEAQRELEKSASLISQLLGYAPTE